MTSESRPDPAEYEAAIDALIDGELDQAGTEALETAAAADPALAQAIVEARRLRQGLDGLRLERTPARLRRRLRRIPAGQRRASGRRVWPRFAAGAFATAALAAFAMLMVTAPEPPAAGARADSDLARVEAARRDLAIAFHYLDKIGARTGEHIRQALHDGVAEPVTGEVSRHLPYTGQSRKEEHS